MIAVFSALALGIVLVLYRPLLLSSAAAELAAARGISVRLVGVLCLIAIALTVSLSALTIGAILEHRAAIGAAATWGCGLPASPGLARSGGADRRGRHLVGVLLAGTTATTGRRAGMAGRRFFVAP